MKDKFDELLEKLNELEITHTGCWEEDVPNDIWEKYFKGNFKEVANGLNVDTHRWYEVSTIVIEIFGKFLGITGVTNIFSESMMHEDCGVELEFSEMKEVQTTTYKEV